MRDRQQFHIKERPLIQLSEHKVFANHFNKKKKYYNTSALIGEWEGVAAEKVKEGQVSMGRFDCRKERRKQQEKSLMRMHVDGKVIHTEEMEEVGEHSGAGEGCRVVVAQLKVSQRGCYMWCQVECLQLEGNDY